MIYGHIKYFILLIYQYNIILILHKGFEKQQYDDLLLVDPSNSQLIEATIIVMFIKLSLISTKSFQSLICIIGLFLVSFNALIERYFPSRYRSVHTSHFCRHALCTTFFVLYVFRIIYYLIIYHSPTDIFTFPHSHDILCIQSQYPLFLLNH